MKNLAYVEGSFCEAYITEEISSFCSLYFEPTMETILNQGPRNDDGGYMELIGHLSNFTCHG